MRLLNYLEEELLSFCSDLENINRKLSAVKLNNFNNQERFNKLISNLPYCISIIKLHSDFFSSELVNVNFYKEITNRFGKKKIKLRFYIQDNYSDPQCCRDEEILNKEFTIFNCLPNFKAIPLQLADNANKYTPEGMTYDITLQKIGNSRYIKCKNLGPSIQKEEKKLISEAGYRGDNTVSIEGMGLGIFQIKQIVSFHTHLKALFYFDSSEPVIEISGIPHSNYETILSYENINNITYKKIEDEKLAPFLLDIICHNVQIEIKTIINFCQELTKINDKEKEWKTIVHLLQTRCNLFQNILNSIIFDRNNHELGNLLWGESNVRLDSMLSSTIKALNKTKFSSKCIELNIEGTLYPMSFERQVFPIVAKAALLLLQCSREQSEIEITFVDNQIIVEFEKEIDSTPIINSIELIYMKNIMSYWNINYSIEEDINVKVKILL